LHPRKSSRPKGRGRQASHEPAFRTLVETSDAGMILADNTGIILYANPASEPLLGRRPQDLVGTLGFDMVRPEDLPLAQEAFGRCLAHSDKIVALRVGAILPGGGVRTLDVRLLNRLADPAIGAVVVHFREAGVDPDRRQEEHYRAVFESAPIGLGVADIEGRLLVFNDAMMQPGGYTRDDIVAIGRVAELYCHEEDRGRILTLAKEQGFVWRQEVQFRRKSGSCYDTLLSLAPVQFGGHPCWLAAVEDITEQKRAEEQRRQLEAQLRQAQKMEAVGRMTAGIAHDFNNVLSVMLGSAQLLADTLGREAPEHALELATLRTAGERGAGLVKKLLGFSRRAPLQVTPTDLAVLVEGLDGMVRHLVPHDISLDVTALPGTRAAVDASAVEQMVLNLVTNARDAMPHGGTLRIDVRPVVLREVDASLPWMTPGAFVRLAVSDTGVGMDEATRGRMFEPFFTTKPAGVGTGLGLPMVYGLAKQQKGFVDVQSEPGKGTTISLYFPHAEPV
jgi:PAS domain S-box-containing protein